MSKLFIGNIPHASSDADLQAWVETQGYKVESSEIIRDRATGQSRGFGFVLLSEDWRVEEAITALNGKRMGGRILTVNHALPLTPRGRPDSSHHRAA
jgi:RNA recognition motif-containing protein